MLGLSLGLVGFALLSATLFDVVKTTLVFTRTGGPMTHRLSRGLWQLLRPRAHESERLARYLGPGILLGIVITWLFLSWVSWTLIFMASPGAVLNSQTMEPAGVAARAYFAGFNLFTLGIGDYVPQGALWQLLSVVSSAQGFFVITLAITYIIPVVASVTQRRQLASQLTFMGERAQDILVRAWNGQSFGMLENRLLSLVPQLVQLEQQHFTYPVLHFFVERERRIAIEPAVVALDEALLMLEGAVSREVTLDHAVISDVRSAISAYLRTLEDEHVQGAQEVPRTAPLGPLSDAGIPLARDAYAETAAAHEKRRRLLSALLQHSGWRWEEVIVECPHED